VEKVGIDLHMKVEKFKAVHGWKTKEGTKGGARIQMRVRQLGI